MPRSKWSVPVLLVAVLSAQPTLAQVAVGPWAVALSAGNSVGNVLACSSNAPGVQMGNCVTLKALSNVAGPPGGITGSACSRVLTATATLTVTGSRYVNITDALTGLLNDQAPGENCTAGGSVTLDGNLILQSAPLPPGQLTPCLPGACFPLPVALTGGTVLCLTGVHTIVATLSIAVTDTTLILGQFTIADFSTGPNSYVVCVADQGPCSQPPLPPVEVLSHSDGTNEFTSRGASGTNAKTVLQRIPADQLVGATAIHSVVFIIQDQDFNTAETGTFEVRRNNPAGPSTGSPDMSPAGLVGSVALGTLTLPTPASGIVSAAVLTVTPTSPIVLPSLGTASPAGDIYVGLSFPSSPNWPNDGISLQASGASSGNAGEQMNPYASGYSGATGQAGLAWDVMTATGVAQLATLNRAWDVQTRFVDDVLQPFASNAAVFTGSPAAPAGTGTGLNPNFGYAGIFPDMYRAGGPDSIGFRLRSATAVGSGTYLFVSTAMAAVPIALSPLGIIGIDPNLTIPSPVQYLFSGNTYAAAPGSAHVSEIDFGPFPGSTSFAGIIVHAQCLTIDPAFPGGARISTTASIHF